MGRSEVVPEAMEGILQHDKKGWWTLDYQRVDGVAIGPWVEKRIHEIPNGAYVRVSIEVLDPDPEV